MRVCNAVAARMDQHSNGTVCLQLRYSNGERQVLCDGPVPPELTASE